MILQSKPLSDRLLDRAGLWKRPETRVLVVGGRASVNDVLLDHSLRNTVHGFYLALHHPELYTTPAESTTRYSRLVGASKEPSNVYTHMSCTPKIILNAVTVIARLHAYSGASARKFAVPHTLFLTWCNSSSCDGKEHETPHHSKKAAFSLILKCHDVVLNNCIFSFISCGNDMTVSFRFIKQKKFLESMYNIS